MTNTTNALFDQAVKLKSELRLIIQVEVNRVNNDKLSFVTNQIMLHSSDIEYNINASLHRCNIDRQVADEIADMLIEYVEICDLVNRISKLRK
jgi:hypothetical protein